MNQIYSIGSLVIVRKIGGRREKAIILEYETRGKYNSNSFLEQPYYKVFLLESQKEYWVGYFQIDDLLSI